MDRALAKKNDFAQAAENVRQFLRNSTNPAEVADAQKQLAQIEQLMGNAPPVQKQSVCDTVRVHSEALQRGIDLFNSAEFFDAHEVLEDVWRAAPEPERKFFQGLIQVAVALHHHTRGNLVGCQSLLARAARNLSKYPARHAGIDVAALLQIVADWRHALETRQPVPPLPRLEMRTL